MSILYGPYNKCPNNIYIQNYIQNLKKTLKNINCLTNQNETKIIYLL